ncbi:putative serine/threonine protein kinase [Teratosphaeria nubilosa]|uniref:non-specific serine/threonine protein kinase n=1 Tax=Teratosphaeria nubilosa TaxID=161662 RepID=A0A6G1L9C5_9PEZI|nr:putative serine/threonine protein kinase [Teratosphaeria nubilosa]
MCIDQIRRRENWAWYRGDSYYPVRIGEAFRSRYQVLGKLGYGAHSTVWLGRDLHAHRYVALKVCERDSKPARREVSAYEHLKSLRSAHAGQRVIRQLLDSFEITVPGGEHLCLIHEPLAMSVETLTDLLPGKQMPESLLKSVLKYLLTDSNMIHADLEAGNMHFRVKDDSIFQNFEKAELENPSPRKIDGDRMKYESRGLILPSAGTTGCPVLCDFGEARFGKESYTDDIQPFAYRAPEVILEIPWSYEVDIWNVGVMIWDLFENRSLFRARDPNGEHSTPHHLAEMIAILGPPPLEYLQRSSESAKYFEPDGRWKGLAPIPDTSLETSITRLSGGNKAQFLELVRKMLQWLPERTHTAKQLLEDPWLNS